MELLVGLVLGLAVGAVIAWAYLSQAKAKSDAEQKEREIQLEKDVREDTLKRSSAAVKGQVGERFAPFLKGFGYQPTDARFLGSPIDYVVFDGLSEGEVRGVAFVEVKTDGAWLSPFERQVREAVEGGRVKWRVVQLDTLTSELRDAT
jgi:predicted Holliday junction resolvase-like endonuclease